MDTRLFFFDIDGTLVPSESQDAPSPRVCQALEALKKAGHKRFLCTGRTLCDIGPNLLAQDFDGIIAGSGACIQLDGKCISHRCVPLPLLRKVAQLMIDNGISGVFSCSDNLYYVGRGKQLPWPLPRLERPEDVTEALGIEKFTAHLQRTEEYSILRDILEPNCEIAVSEDRLFYEMTAKHVTKASAVEILCHRLGRSPADAVAFGDSDNDVALLRLAGTGVAMGGAAEAVKQSADYVTDTLEADGIAAALIHLGYIGER
ncbi:MAG: Cof-type HAD-IIB family hydrolase [Clostridiales bacterium]|nr:Cof-type HAD-IIB family hydrolase [Clostridiales bacterium]